MHLLASRALALIAALLLLVALVKPWMAVPSDIIQPLSGPLRCVTSQPRAAIPFRAACLLFSLVMGFGHVWHRRTSDRKAILAGAFLSSLLFFPFTVMAWEPPLSAQANWLQIQHENLVWLGGDLPTNLEYSRKVWRNQIYVVDTPRQINVIRMPTSGLSAFQFGRLMTWFETLGYSNRFCQFVKPGWICALFGTMALILAECVPAGRLKRARMVRGALASAVAFGCGLLSVSVPVVRSSLDLDRCRSAVAMGLFDDADEALHNAIRDLPALREDTFYVAQLGLIDFRRGRFETPEGRLFRANLLERQGRYSQAMVVYQELLSNTKRGTAVHREVVRAVLRAGLHALNGQRNDLATQWLEQVLNEEPCNLKANYALQLAYLRTDRRKELERMVERIVAIYKHFQMPTKDIVLASSYENAMISAYRAHDLSAAHVFATKAKHP